MSGNDDDDDNYEYEYDYEYDRDEEYDEEERDEEERDEEVYIAHGHYTRNDNTNSYEGDDENEGDPRDDETYRDWHGHLASTSYDNSLQDVFSIHTSNEQIFNSIGNSQDLQARLYSNLGTISCPVCSERIHISNITNHMVYYHSTFYLSLSMLMNPNLSMGSWQGSLNPMNSTYNTIQSLMFNDDENDNASYEDLLNLCDYIGYHKPGIKEVDAAAPVMEDIEALAFVCEEDTCRICLEGLQDVQPIRKIRACGHMFCSECITEWFKENKTCPLCNIDCSPPENTNEQDGGDGGDGAVVDAPLDGVD